ncbi:MAG TPA: BatD family protein [Steroidobacteraceae bacterium]|nr:BatD family protein [Steroidobacteraceae bacterium]
MKTAIKWLCCSSALLLLGNVHAAVRAWVDSSQIAPGDTVQLTIEHDGQTSDQPDLSPLKQDFDVLSSSRSSNVQIINGNMSSKVQLQLMLSPKHNGALHIPSITWGSDHSSPIDVQVNASAGDNNQTGGGTSNDRPVFMQTTVDQSQPYVQAAVKVTVRIYASTTLYQAGLDLPGNNDVLIQQVGKDQSSTVVRNGKRYQMIERHYLLFPQRSGKLTVPGAVLNAQIAVRDRNNPFDDDDAFNGIFGGAPFNGMMTSTKPLRLHGDDIVLNVQPRPAQANGSYWLPATHMDVTAQWHPDVAHVKVGDPVTLELHQQAEGLTAAQLPDLSSLLQLPSGIKAYPDQARLSNNTQGDTVVGTRDQSIALIADEPGQFTIPALHVQWWDTQAKQMRDVTVPSRTLTITGMPNTNVSQNASPALTAAPPSMQSATSASGSHHAVAAAVSDVNVRRWQWISVALTLLWLITLAAWWYSYRFRKAKSPAQTTMEKAEHPKQLSAAQARDEFIRACKQNDAARARRNLLAWIAAEWGNAAPNGLRAFASQAGNAELNGLLLELDRAVYLGEHWNGTKLMAVLNKLPSSSATPKKEKEKELASLYH